MIFTIMEDVSDGHGRAKTTYSLDESNRHSRPTGSTRLPRKLLLRETGKSLIQHTYEAAAAATRPTGICVAADHAEIFDEVRAFGGQVEMTDPARPQRHRSRGRGRPAE